MYHQNTQTKRTRMGVHSKHNGTFRLLNKDLVANILFHMYKPEVLKINQCT